MTDFRFDPRKTALLNIDMQNCFVENSPVAAPRGREIVPRINKLAEVCRRRGALVIHTLHLVRPDGSNTGVMGVIIPAIAAGLINKGNKQAELHPDIVSAGTILSSRSPATVLSTAPISISFCAIAASIPSSLPAFARMCAAKRRRGKPI